MSAPRVLVLGSVLGQARGGVWRHNGELLPRAARLLAEAGGSLTVLEGREPCGFSLPPEVERLSSSIPGRPILARALFEERELKRVLKECHEQGRGFDLLHTAHQPVPRGHGLPFSLLIHDLRSLQLRGTVFSRRFLAREVIGDAVKRATQLMTVSHAMAASISKELDVELERIDLIPNAGDHFQALPRQTPAKGPLLCLGHLEARKNQQLLIETLALDPDLPDVEFIGSAKGDEEQRLRKLAIEGGVSQRVHFPGALDDEDLRSRFAATACVVLPSILEGFGIVALEAQLARAPLALSDISAHREVAPQARFFDDDPQACARAIRAAMQSPVTELAAHAEQCRGRFDWERSARLLVASWTRMHRAREQQG